MYKFSRDVIFKVFAVNWPSVKFSSSKVTYLENLYIYSNRCGKQGCSHLQINFISTIIIAMHAVAACYGCNQVLQLHAMLITCSCI